MKTLLYIYLGISILTLILYAFTTLDISFEFKRRYPNANIAKSHFIEKVSSCFKTVLVSFMPILNICMFFVLLFKGDELTEKSIQKVLSKSKEENK